MLARKALRHKLKLLAVRGWVNLAPHKITPMELRDIVLTLVGAALTAWVAALVVRRKFHREFPFFFTYLIVSVLVPVLRLAVSGDYPMFFTVFWATEALYAVLALLALYEVFHEVFLPFYQLWWWFRLLFPGAALLIAFLSIRHALHPWSQRAQPMEIIVAFATSVNYLEALLFGLFFALVLLLGVRWRSYPFGIVEGFGLYALGGLIAYRLRSEFGTKYNTIVKYALPVAYVVGVLVWLDTFLRQPDPELVHAWRDKITPQQLLAEARGYIKTLKRFFGTKP